MTTNIKNVYLTINVMGNETKNEEVQDVQFEDGYCKGPVPMCFDELGREPNPAKYYGTELNVMQHILHIRYSLWQQGGLKTFVTTNFNAKEIGDLYGDFIRDRRREMFNILVMNGESRRGTK